MLNRRQFLAAGGTSLLAAPMSGLWTRPAQAAQRGRKRLAVVTTLWTYRSHSWHMAERFLHGYPLEGEWHHPDWQVVSAYVDQRPQGDLSGKRAAESGFTVYETVADALRCGGDQLAVDAVLLIGEHGDYPLNEFGQKLYPRYELFKQVTDVFRSDGRSVPVFNDKHLSWNFEWAQEMVQQAEELDFPLLAGSSLPVTWRMPAIDVPWGAEVEEALVVAYGGKDIYDFHAFETLQCMMERRRGGEVGVKRVQGIEGPAVWNSLNKSPHGGPGWDAELFEACLSRSHTLAQPESFSHRYPTREQMWKWCENPRAYWFEYNDGTRATVLMLNGLVTDFTFAARIKGQAKPISTLFHLPPNPNVVYSAALMANAERMFNSRQAPYPAERTMLTSGMVESALQSIHKHKALPTPHLAVRYQAPRESTYWHS